MSRGWGMECGHRDLSLGGGEVFGRGVGGPS